MLTDVWAIGIDLGATKAGIAQVDSLGTIHKRDKVLTGSSKDASIVIEEIAAAIRPMLGEMPYPPAGIGIGIAGQVDSKQGVVVDAPNLDWHNVAICEQLRDELGLGVVITNDVRAATRGEWLYGSGQDCDDLVCIFIGTGIGGGVVSGGRMLKGSSNTFGEIGHMTVNLDGPRCPCGNIGCVEAIAGGAALGRRAREAIELDENHGQRLLDLAKGNINDITGKTLAEAFRKGDVLSKEIVAEAQEALLSASVGIVNVLNPQKLIFSGGVVIGFPELIDQMIEKVHGRALPSASKHLEILQGELKNDAGIIGSASLAIHQFAE